MKQLVNKLALGTAQFGFDYGINNKRGRIPQKEVFEILQAAVHAGIDTLDTSSVYGRSEEVLGEFVSTHGTAFKIISKTVGTDISQMRESLLRSLAAMRLTSIYGYLIHDFKNFLDNPSIWQELGKFKKEGLIEKIGFSIYSPEQLNILFARDIVVDVIQLPYSVFDQRFNDLFPVLKKKGIAIYTRSVFLQGIAFQDPGTIDEALSLIGGKLENLNAVASQKKLSILSLCIGFALSNPFIDKIIVGVDGISNYLEIIDAVRFLPVISDAHIDFSAFSEKNIERIYDYLIEIYRQKHSGLMPRST